MPPGIYELEDDLKDLRWLRKVYDFFLGGNLCSWKGLGIRSKILTVELEEDPVR